jgi:APA family basic amino acid/polyamine antiporter
MLRSKLFRKKSIETTSLLPSQALIKNLGVRDLTSLGIAAIIGAGIFSTIGSASASGGPAVCLLFIFTSLACLFSALCYAQFASSVPVAGSAYTYAYIAFGEIVAWIIGWDLLMEYAIGNIAVAISWSDYFTSFLEGLGVRFPSYLSMDYFTAYKIYHEHEQFSPNEIHKLLPHQISAIEAYQSAPVLGNIKVILDLPALAITVFVTWLVFIGIKESKKVNNILVIIKIGIVLMVITIGAFYVNTSNWHPFAPNGIDGILKGVSSVFFAYIGFDAISTTAEECKNPRKDLPKAMLYALAICTILYVMITLVLTGMINYKELNIGDPLAYAFKTYHLDFLSGIIGLSAIIAMTGVLLVFQLGQPRIWMSMSRDGLLPGIFSKIHPRYKTPTFSTLLAGMVVAVPSMFLNLTEVTDLCSIGTLFAFVVVCAGILFTKPSENPSVFKVPYINGKYIIPVLMSCVATSLFLFDPDFAETFFKCDHWNIFKHKIPLMVFIISSCLITVIVYFKNLSLIPVLGLLTNLYLMTELGYTNWIRFIIWLLIGLIIYFIYGINKSKLTWVKK